MDNRLDQDALVEDALNDLPLEPMPRDLVPGVMARVKSGTRPAIFSWRDLVVGFVVLLAVGALFFAVQNLSPLALAKLRIQGILLYQDLLIHARWLVPAAFIGLTLLLASLALSPLGRNNRGD
jgi:hypothetical protein